MLYQALKKINQDIMTMINKVNIIKGDQYEFWEDESSVDGYCESFIDDVKNNRWLNMLFRVEKKKKIKVSGRVLELGGGSQYLSRYIAKNRDSRVVCTDISNQRIKNFNEYHREELANLSTVGDVNAEKIPYENESFDFIIGEAMLHHIEDIRSALYEINRCLKPGGVAIF